MPLDRAAAQGCDTLCLLYEYAARGSLDKMLKDDSSALLLTWQLRLRIMLQIATALNFMQQALQQPRLPPRREERKRCDHRRLCRQAHRTAVCPITRRNKALTQDFILSLPPCPTCASAPCSTSRNPSAVKKFNNMQVHVP